MLFQEVLAGGREAVDQYARFKAERAVRELMGNQVEYRRDYIERHAKDARYLDI